MESPPLVKLNLGCGEFPIDGWHNLDIIKHPGVIQTNLAHGIPFANNSVDAIRSEHFLEHLTLLEGKYVIKESYRCLKPGGVIRIAVPDLELAVRDYRWNKLNRMERVGLVYESKAIMLNRAFRDWGHQCMYDEELLRTTLEEFFFQKIKRHRARKPGNNIFCSELREDFGELVLEAVKEI